MADSQIEAPQLIMLAGPNGSGKSTITSEFQTQANFPTNYINPDEIALTIPGESMEKAYEAASIANRQREEYLQNRESFAFETVASHPSKFLFLQEAKEAGYDTTLIFVSTTDPQINIQRVKQRVETGGHDVPRDKIISRYYRSMQLLALGAEIASNVRVFDNTARPIEVATVKNGLVVSLAKPTPVWVERLLVESLAVRSLERKEIIESAQTRSLNLLMANFRQGSYCGVVASLTSHYLIQQIDPYTLVQHDRVVLNREAQSGQRVAINYIDGAGKIEAIQEKSLERD